MTLAFGTDGMRGKARTELSAALVAALGRAGAEFLGVDGFVIGRDPRESGPELSQALAAGVTAAGGVPTDLGVVPTPAVARWCSDHSVAGAMVSASHNPWHDNGVKLFASGGLKLDDATQHSIQDRMAELLADESDPLTETSVDMVDGHEAAVKDHVAAVVATLSGRHLDGLRVVLDTANGAASGVAPDAFRQLGADIVVMHDQPDGHNINDRCGSTHPASLQAAVVDHHADLGVAFDGDADRLIAVDANGDLVDGDHIIAICALDQHRRGILVDDTVVVTVMTNLGFRRSMAANDIAVVETGVGDRYVLEALDALELNFGGEQSGHVIFRDLATTGDGLLTAVQLADVVARTGTPLADLAAASMTRLPQVLRNVKLASQPDNLDELLAPLIAAATTQLADRGRVLVRLSGTEPLVRVMVEADTNAEAESVTAGLVEAVAALVAS